MSAKGPRDARYTFDDYLQHHLSDEDWRIEWGGEEAIARVATSLYRARGNRGLSQVQLAERAGTKQPNISAIETGEGNPTVRTLGRLAAALGMDVSELLGGGDRYGVYRRTGFDNLRRRSEIDLTAQGDRDIEKDGSTGEGWSLSGSLCSQFRRGSAADRHRSKPEPARQHVA